MSYIYGIIDTKYVNHIKIGSTDNYVRRYFNYQTYSHLPWQFKFVYQINSDFSCYEIDELIKIEFNKFRQKVPYGGTEWYNLEILDYINKFLKDFNVRKL